MIKLEIVEKNGKFVVDTPYTRKPYEFKTREKAEDFVNYCMSDPDYQDPDLGDITEYIYYMSEKYPDLFRR